MSLIIKKRPILDQSKVNTIKIRKLENENYRIENNEGSFSSVDNSFNQSYETSFDQSYQDSYNNSSQGMFEPEAFLQQNMYDQSEPQHIKSEPQQVDDDGELVCTPSFDAFDSIISQNQQGEAEEEEFNLPLEIKIDSITSLNPTFDQSQQQSASSNGYMMYNEDDPGVGGIENVSQMFKGKKRRPIRHLVYIFAEDGNRYFPCHCCTSAFIKKYLLIKHIVAKHKEIVVCKMCACIFYPQMQESFQQHMKAHNTRLPTQTKQCPLCLFWLTPKSYQGHLSNHNLLQKHICRQCRQEFPTFYIRARHVCPMRN